MSEQVKRYALLHGTLEFADALCPVYLPRWVRAVDYDALAQRFRELEGDRGDLVGMVRAARLERDTRAQHALSAIEASVALRAEVERLTCCLERANSQAEHFERNWYLRGDELDDARAEVEALRTLVNRIQQIVTHPHESKDALAARVRNILEAGACAPTTGSTPEA